MTLAKRDQNRIEHTLGDIRIGMLERYADDIRQLDSSDIEIACEMLHRIVEARARAETLPASDISWQDPTLLIASSATYRLSNISISELICSCFVVEGAADSSPRSSADIRGPCVPSRSYERYSSAERESRPPMATKIGTTTDDHRLCLFPEGNRQNFAQ